MTESRRQLAAALLAVALLVLTPGDVRADEGERTVAPGVRYERIERPGLVAHVARVAPEVAFLRPVLASDAVSGGPREAVSSMCTRVGGIICINADFAACPTCREPFGGAVVDGRVLRTPHAAHEQLSFTSAGMTTDTWTWGGRLVFEQVWWVDAGPDVVAPSGERQRIELRRERRELPLGGLNVGPVVDGAVLYTPAWGPTTAGSALEVLVATDASFAPGAAAVEPGPQRAGAGPIPPTGAVIAADGAAVEELARIADEWRNSDATEKRLVLETATSAEIFQSVGGHPVLLRDGQRQDWWRGDAKARGRHPRTLVGWTGSGEVLLVVVDGRQPGHSEGLTLDESADLLLSLGAVQGLNLDGGGSSAFIGPCADGPCVLNRPSDGRERLVTGALALLGDRSAIQPVMRPAAPPLAPPAAPTEPDPASTAHVAPPPPEPAAAPEGGDGSDASPAGDDVALAPTSPPPSLPPAATGIARPGDSIPAYRPRSPDDEPASRGAPATAATLVLGVAAAGVARQVARSRARSSA